MNRLVLITGATGGVGISLCRHLAGTFQVLAVGRNEKLLEDLCSSTKGVTPLVADLGIPKSLDQMMDHLLANYTYIPYLINNAGIMVASDMVDLSPEAMQLSLQVNALSPFRIMQGLIPRMVDNDFGRIINITSGAPLNCFAGYTAYNVSKAALNALTVTSAREHGKKNIKINLMSPGPVRSNMAPTAPMDPEVCHPTLDYLLNLDENGPTGHFFWLGRELPLFPDLEGVAWLEGTASNRFPEIFK